MKPALILALVSSLAATSPATAQTIVDLTNGRLSLTTPNSDQSVRVEVGPSPGVARVYGFPGLRDGRAFGGVTGITLVTGAGQDAVELAIQAAQSLDVRVDTQGGDAVTTVLWDLLSSVQNANASLALAATGGRMGLATVELTSDVEDARISLDTGPAIEVATKLSSPNHSSFLGLDFRSAATKLTLDVGSAASTLEIALRGGKTATASELSHTISQSVPATVSLDWNLQTGNRADTVVATIAAPGSTVTHRGLVNTAGGNDRLQVETDAFGTVTGIELRGGGGADLLSQVVKGRFLASQTLQTRVFGGAGDDELVLTTDTGIYGTGLPNDLFPVINCGDGTDRFNAFGRIISCESRL